MLCVTEVKWWSGARPQALWLPDQRLRPTFSAPAGQGVKGSPLPPQPLHGRNSSKLERPEGLCRYPGRLNYRCQVTDPPPTFRPKPSQGALQARTYTVQLGGQATSCAGAQLLLKLLERFLMARLLPGTHWGRPCCSEASGFTLAVPCVGCSSPDLRTAPWPLPGLHLHVTSSARPPRLLWVKSQP